MIETNFNPYRTGVSYVYRPSNLWSHTPMAPLSTVYEQTPHAQVGAAHSADLLKDFGSFGDPPVAQSVNVDPRVVRIHQNPVNAFDSHVE